MKQVVTEQEGSEDIHEEALFNIQTLPLFTPNPSTLDSALVKHQHNVGSEEQEMDESLKDIRLPLSEGDDATP